MNETLTVRDFGPIKDATVVFKRVTVFIGPTGGGKSTLAKLAAVWKEHSIINDEGSHQHKEALGFYSIASYWREGSFLKFIRQEQPAPDAKFLFSHSNLEKIRERSADSSDALGKVFWDALTRIIELAEKNGQQIVPVEFFVKNTLYIPAERTLYAAISFSLAGFMRDDLNLPKTLLEFVNEFARAKKEITDLELPLFGVKYEQRGGDDYIRIPGREKPLFLYETASGIQSVAPLLVLLEYLSRQTERPQSFIIEEPELNLFPEAQQALLQTLIEKCTQGDNDLIITTHSPYVLTVLNTLMYAHKVAHEVPENAKKVEKLIPRKYWIDPAQFAAYYVDLPTTRKKQQVRSIVDKKTGMIGENELDHLSFTLADLLGNLLDLRTPPQPKAKAATAAK